MTACQTIRENLAILALGALEADRRREVEAHLRDGCVACAAALAREIATAECLRVLVADEPSEAASASLAPLRAALLQQVERPGSQSGRGARPSGRPADVRIRRRTPWGRLALAAAVALVAVALRMWVGPSPTKGRPPDSAPPRIVSLLADPRTPRARLYSGTHEVGIVLYDEGRRQMLVFAPGLPSPSLDRIRVLWCRPRGRPDHYDNLGAFVTDPATGADHVWRDAPPLAMMEAVEVSEEIDPAIPAPSRIIAKAEVP